MQYIKILAYVGAIDLQILFVVKHKQIVFQYEIYQCRNVIDQCLVI